MVRCRGNCGLLMIYNLCFSAVLMDGARTWAGSRCWSQLTTYLPLAPPSVRLKLSANWNVGIPHLGIQENSDFKNIYFFHAHCVANLLSVFSAVPVSCSSALLPHLPIIRVLLVERRSRPPAFRINAPLWPVGDSLEYLDTLTNTPTPHTLPLRDGAINAVMVIHRRLWRSLCWRGIRLQF